METSNLIALGALIVSVVGLFPQFYSIFSKKDKKKKSNETADKNNAIYIKNEGDEKIEKEEMPVMLRILMLVVFAVASFLIEIILFSLVAHLFSVNVDLATMPLVWKIIFFSLFLIPSVFLFLAFLTFIANTED